MADLQTAYPAMQTGIRVVDAKGKRLLLKSNSAKTKISLSPVRAVIDERELSSE
jgi:hypothetical protein